jgi:hypothetical protein
MNKRNHYTPDAQDGLNQIQERIIYAIKQHTSMIVRHVYLRAPPNFALNI